jgi:2-methylcitrate dehydratase PrpD
MSITVTLARFAAETETNTIPQPVLERALALMSDLVGSIVRAASESESTPSILGMLRRAGMDGEGTCTVFGMNRRYGAAAAALLNGALGHSLDFDDTHSDSSLHPSAPVIPAALAAAELSDASGEELLAAIVIGFEVACRIGMALDPTAHYARGFHPTATAGNFGAAAAAGRLMKLDATQMASAFGVAASQASGSLQFLENGAWNKRYQVGEAAMKGFLAASLAAEQFHGAADALEGRHGFLNGYTDGADGAKAVSGLGETWETLRIGVKPYPTCRYTHAAVDGLLTLRARHELSADQVTRISVGLHRNGMALVGDPADAKRRARSIVDGQFSMPFAAAVAMLRGRFGWDDYDLLGNSQVNELSDKVDTFRDESLEGLTHPFGATLALEARGERFTLRIANPSGEPDTFPDEAAFAAKFAALTSPVLNAASATLQARLAALPSAPSVRSHFA